MGAFTRLRREVEPKWVSQYIAETWPNVKVQPRCPLGPIPKDVEKAYGAEKGARVFRPWRPEVDALVFAPKELILIEAKISKPMDGLSKLPVYKAMVPDTPELKEFSRLPVKMQLLLVQPLPWVIEAARRVGVEIVNYAPKWVVEIWEERDRYWGKKAIEERELRKKRMKAAGIE